MNRNNPSQQGSDLGSQISEEEVHKTHITDNILLLRILASILERERASLRNTNITAMDFELAERKLKSDQKKLRSQVRNRNAARTLASTDESTKAKRLEAFRKQQLEKRKAEEEIQRKQLNRVTAIFRTVEKRLGVNRYIKSDDTPLCLEATSVHGQGDKITLPASILASLADKDLLSASRESGQPLFFRLGIRRPNYVFPQSDAMKNIMNGFKQTILTASTNSDENENLIDLSDDDFDDEMENSLESAYVDELNREYISYTYATVIEFSQDEGFIGLPESTAKALLQSNGSELIPSKTTIDPAVAKKGVKNDSDAEMAEEGHEEFLEQKTPGHPAYNLFEVPASPIEISLITNLPLGSKCALQPSEDSIKKGFYGLVDVKLALEQSLIRTRGCLNVGDLVHCWFRGKKFDLTVADVYPESLRAISCVNCDIEVDIIPVGNSTSSESDAFKEPVERTESGGYRLGGSVADPSVSLNKIEQNNVMSQTKLPVEPQEGEREGVITIQIKGLGKSSKRRFFEHDKLDSIFDFVIADGLSSTHDNFRLVTRYPRRVFERGEGTISDYNFSKTEVFLVEKM